MMSRARTGSIQLLTKVASARPFYAAQTDSLAACSVVWVDRTHPDRAGLEAFIAGVFLRKHGARLESFCDTLMGFRASDGAWVAAVGFTPLAYRQAFLEQYLDAPVEQIAQASQQARSDSSLRLSRWEMVEVGNLASEWPGVSRAMILRMTRYLHLRGFRWVVFTATRCLSNAFDRLAFHPVALADADAERLQEAAASWGSYFNARPRVMLGDISTAFAQLRDANR
jgi:hypothetical protein